MYQYTIFLISINQFVLKIFQSRKCQLKWNSLGTALLALASTDHDTTNKSYYGETNLYLLGIAGSYDSRIDLKREGPIHDITWSPTAREFAVSYGYMPSETTFSILEVMPFIHYLQLQEIPFYIHLMLNLFLLPGLVIYKVQLMFMIVKINFLKLLHLKHQILRL